MRAASVGCAALLIVLAGCSAPDDSPPAADATANPLYQARKQQFLVLYQAGNFSAALEEAKATVELAPRVEEPYVWASKLFTDLGRDEEGAAFFRATAERHPEVAYPWFYLGYQEVHLSRMQDAQVSFARATEIAPDNAEAWYRQGLILQTEGAFERAAEVFTKAYELDRNQASRAVRLVEVLRTLGREDEAEAIAVEALARAPRSAELNLAVGQIRLRQRRLEEAEAALRLAVQLDGGSARAHRELGNTLMRSGREEEARQQETIARRLDDYNSGRLSIRRHLANSRDPAVPMLLAEIELTERKYDEALRWFRRSEQLGLHAPRVFAGIAETCFRRGDTACGEQALARLAGRDGGRVALARAARHTAAGERDAAASELERAVEIGPREREFLRRAADLWADLDRAARSVELLARADAAPGASSAPETLGP